MQWNGSGRAYAGEKKKRGLSGQQGADSDSGMVLWHELTLHSDKRRSPSAADPLLLAGAVRCTQVLEVSGTTLDTKTPWDASKTFGDVLLAPTIIYVRKILKLHEELGLKGVVHITGGGMTENIPRCIPKGLGVAIKADCWPAQEIFKWIQKTGNVPTDDMRRTFNMGVGIVVIVDPSQVEAVKKIAPDAFDLGEVVAGDGGVKYV